MFYTDRLSRIVSVDIRVYTDRLVVFASYSSRELSRRLHIERISILRVRTCVVIMLFGNLPAIAQDYRSHHDKGTRGTAIAIQFAKPVTDYRFAVPRISEKQYLWQSFVPRKY